MSNLKQNCMGTTVMARITHDTVELNLPEWSGRMTREEAVKEISQLRLWLREVANTLSDHIYQEAVRIEELCEKDPCEDGCTFENFYTVNGIDYRYCKYCYTEQEVSWREQIVNEAIEREARS